VCDRKLRGVLCYFQFQENQTKQINISQATCKKLRESEAVNGHLKKELAAKGKVLKFNNKKQEQLQSLIDVLSKTAENPNRTVQRVITCKIQVVTTLKRTKMFSAINRFKFRPNTGVSQIFLCLYHQDLFGKYS